MSADRPIAGDLIQLPRFDSAGAATLGERLLAAADAAGPLPKPIQRAREALEGELAGVKEAAARAAAVASPEVDAADCVLDTCWTALHAWLQAFADLPGEARESSDARALLAELYPSGLDFIELPYELEWGQSDQRLARIHGERLGDSIAALGGRAFIDALRSAHATYGRVLGLDASRAERPASLREALDGFAAALRVYADKVTAHVEVEAPETTALAKLLLEPLLTWRST